MATGTKLSSFSNLVASWTKRFFVRSRSLPIAVGVALLTTTLILWQALLAQERADIEQAIQLEASNANFQITRQLQERTQALERMAKRWEYSGKPPKDYWEADAKLYVENYSGFQAIEWVDPSFYVGWIVPMKGNEAVQNLYLGFEPRRKMALEAARNQRQTIVTRTINLRQGGKGFLVYVPISQQEDFGGFIVGVFRTTEFLDTIFNDLDKRTGRKYALRIFDGNEQIYSHYLGNGANENKWGQDTTITFNGVTWRMRVWPEQQFLAEQRSPLPTVVLIAGLLMAVLLPLAIDLAQIARRRAKKVERVNQELQREMIQRKLAEESLKKHAQMLDLANDTIMIRDLDDSISYWNQGAERLYGWRKEEVLGKVVHTLLQTEFPQPLEEIRDIFLRQGYWQGELVHLTGDGTQITVESRWTLQRDEQGQPSAILEINNDISDRKQAEQRLEAQYITAQVLGESVSLSEATPKILQAICDSLGWDVGELWSVNQQGHVLDFVTAYYQPSIKVPEFEAVTRSLTFAPGVGLPGWVWEKGEPVWTTDVVQDCSSLRAAVAEKAGLHGAFGFPILDSKEVLGVITFFSREIRQPDNELLEMVTAIGQQIGQFIERRQAEKELEQQRQWLEITLSSIGDAVIATDTAAVITFMNPIAEALTGWTVQDALGRKIDEVFCIIDEYTRQPAEIPLERVLREGVVVELADNTVLITRDAREIPIDDSCAPIRNESGTLQGAVLIFRDITKRKLAEWEIRNALAKEKELNELKSRFISMTSHEFRTPLTTILGSSELLEHYSHKLTEEKKLNHLHRIQTTVKHLAHLLDDVLLIGKADAGRVDVNPEPINLEQFCHTLVEELQLSASTQHTLTFVSQAQCTDACMDEKLLRHILSNLLSNAIKYSPAGGTVHFALACQNREAIFQIRDEGIGIPPEDLKQLFESFHRATNVGNIAGTGLGLAIVKKSVDLQGGKIEVNSQVGVGTAFTVTLPLNKEN